MVNCEATRITEETVVRILWMIVNNIRPVRSTFAVRETASLGRMGAPRVPPLNPAETIVLSEHYRL